MLYVPVMSLALIVAGGAWYGYGEYQRRERAAAESRKPRPVINPLSQTFPGQIRPQKTVQVAVPVAGTLESLEVSDGEEVIEGQLLARILNSGLAAAKQRAVEELDRAKGRVSELESQVLAARLEASRASADMARVRIEYETASRAYDRQQKLFREGATARRSYEKAEVDYRKLLEENKSLEETAARSEAAVKRLHGAVDEARGREAEKAAELEDADDQLLSGEVKAPVSGVITGHSKNAGDEVTRDIGALFEIATDLTAMEAVVEVPEVVGKKLMVGGRAFVQISEAGEAPVNGVIREVKDGKAVVEFLSPNAGVKPGMSAQVRFLAGE